MSGVADHTVAFLQHLNKINLTLGVMLTVKDKNDYDGSVELELADKKVMYVSKDVAKNILVKVK